MSCYITSFSDLAITQRSNQQRLSGMRYVAFVRDESTALGGLIDMPRQSVISDLMSLAARYNSFTLSLQSTISNGGCSQDILSVAAALHV